MSLQAASKMLEWIIWRTGLHKLCRKAHNYHILRQPCMRWLVRYHNPSPSLLLMTNWSMSLIRKLAPHHVFHIFSTPGSWSSIKSVPNLPVSSQSIPYLKLQSNKSIIMSDSDKNVCFGWKFCCCMIRKLSQLTTRGYSRPTLQTPRSLGIQLLILPMQGLGLKWGH